MFHRLAAVQFLFHGCDRFFQRKPASVQNPECFFQLGADFQRHPRPGQTHAVQARHKSRIPRYQHKRRDILGYSAHTAGHGVPPDAAELVHGCQAADNGPVFHDDMACQGSHIRHDHVVAHDTVVGDMGIGHHQYIVADTGLVAFPAGTAHGNTFAEHAPVADNGITAFPFKLQILWDAADGSSREKFTVFADCCIRMNHYMRTYNAAIPQHHVMFNYRIRTNYYIFADLRAFFYNRGLVYLL